MSEPKAENWASSKLTLAFRASLLLLAFAAPISIAATQTAWALALLFWLLRLGYERPRLKVDPLDISILAFLGFTVLSSATSYEPETSIRKLVAVSLVSILYLVSSGVRTQKLRRTLTALLLLGAVTASLYAVGTFAVGKNLKVLSMEPDSVLIAAGVKPNDTILMAAGKWVSSPEQLAEAVRGSRSETAGLKVYRVENILDMNVPRSSADALGITHWQRGRDTRASGFFGHYTTFSEAVQLVLALAFALFVASAGKAGPRLRAVLAAVIVLFAAALFLTVTRASWAGAAAAGAVIVLLGTSRRTILICTLLAVPLAAGGLYYLQQKRNVAFIDSSDGSTTWRATVWRESLTILTSDPRHLAVGVGMDSLKSRWREWGMFDNGNIPMGHLHSTPLQIAFERGVPALIAWLAWMFFYLKTLWKKIRRRDDEWPEHGLYLGAFAGTIGFLVCGLVHYNWGDSEVIMIFYLISGLVLSTISNDAGEPSAA